MIRVIVGGQFGSEGKGKLVAHLALKERSMFPDKPIMGVRCGGPNAGHTIYVPDADGNIGPVVTRHVSSAVVVPDATVSIPAGGMIDPEVLSPELGRLQHLFTGRKLLVDYHTAIVTKMNKALESKLRERIASTATGTGSCQSDRVMREAMLMAHYASGDAIIQDTVQIGSVSADAIATHQRGGLVLVEGTQGYGLSNYHGTYPFCTSKCTTSAHFLSEAGLPPNEAVVAGVFRAYPIRVGGPSGPLSREIDWDTVRQRSGYDRDLVERTSVTKTVRRVGEFNWAMFTDSIQVNGISEIALHGADHIDRRALDARSWDELPNGVHDMVDRMETIGRRVGRPVTVRWVFNGPTQDHIIER